MTTFLLAAAALVVAAITPMLQVYAQVVA